MIDPLISKRQQLLLATQLCRMVLKVCNIFVLYCTLPTFGHFVTIPCPPFVQRGSRFFLHPLHSIRAAEAGEPGKRHDKRANAACKIASCVTHDKREYCGTPHVPETRAPRRAPCFLVTFFVLRVLHVRVVLRC